jgi:predicted glutamine amidotransferase
MCRLVGWVAAQPISLADALGPAALHRLLHLSTVHCDGWGAAWHDESGSLQTARSLRPAHDDQQFAELASGLFARDALVHLRLGTPGYGDGLANTHPFVAGELAFAHNGAIGPHRRVDQLLRDPDDAAGLIGQTDSERYFRAVRDELAELDPTDVAEAVRRVAARMHERGLRANSLNALLLGPDALRAVSEHDEVWEPGSIPVWPADDLTSGIVQPRYLAMAYRAQVDRVVVLSSGIVSDPEGWVELPSHSVLTIDRETRELGISPTAAWSMSNG